MDYFPLGKTVSGTTLDKLAHNINGHEMLVLSTISPLPAHYYQHHVATCLLYLLFQSEYYK